MSGYGQESRSYYLIVVQVACEIKLLIVEKCLSERVFRIFEIHNEQPGRVIEVLNVLDLSVLHDASW